MKEITEAYIPRGGGWRLFVLPRVLKADKCLNMSVSIQSFTRFVTSMYIRSPNYNWQWRKDEFLLHGIWVGCPCGLIIETKGWIWLRYFVLALNSRQQRCRMVHHLCNYLADTDGDDILHLQLLFLSSLWSLNTSRLDGSGPLPIWMDLVPDVFPFTTW